MQEEYDLHNQINEDRKDLIKKFKEIQNQNEKFITFIKAF